MLRRMSPLLILFFLSFSAFGSNRSLKHQVYLQSLRKPIAEDTSCKMVFSLWQKDAYSDVGGRSEGAIPVHTSSFLQVICHKDLVAQVNKGNYGSQIGQVDQNGKNLLDLVYMDSMKVTLEEGMAFQGAFANLSCSDFSDFLTYEKARAEFQDLL